jgi:hypothetical protein
MPGRKREGSMDFIEAELILKASCHAMLSKTQEMETLLNRVGLKEVELGEILEEAAEVFAHSRDDDEDTIESVNDMFDFNKNIIRLFWESLRLNEEYISDYEKKQGDVTYFQKRYFIHRPLNPAEALTNNDILFLNSMLMDTLGISFRFLPMCPQKEVVNRLKIFQKIYLPEAEIEIKPDIEFRICFRSLKTWRLHKEGHPLEAIAEAGEFAKVNSNIKEEDYTLDHKIDQAKKDIPRAEGLIHFAGEGLRSFAQGDIKARDLTDDEKDKLGLNRPLGM